MATASSNSFSEGKGFCGNGVLSLESRFSEVMGESIRRHGGNPILAPSMQEIALENNPELLSFGEQLYAGKIDILVLFTGVGTRMMIEILSKNLDQAGIIDALSRTTLLARGPKPVEALKKFGLRPSLTVPEPNTWQEILETLDHSRQGVNLKDSLIAVQEYGISNTRFIHELTQRGARVVQVPVYRWALPDDKRPMLDAIKALLAGHVSCALFTNAAQIRHFLRLSVEQGVEKEVRNALKQVVIASIGPSCSEALKDCGISIDFEPSHPKMGHLISETAKQAEKLIEEKKNTARVWFDLNPRSTDPEIEKSRRADSPFLKACRLEPSGVTPVWFMRQAGRYMKEYRDLRKKVGFLELCKRPDLCAQVTVHAQEKIGADAAIIFSDLLLILEPMGLGLEYTPGDGPSISGKIMELRDVDNLREAEPAESLAFVFDSVRQTRAALSPLVPLIGFAGAPFTLASYIVEGGPSKFFLKTKTFMYGDPGAWHALMEKIVRAVSKLVTGQIEAGADAIQIFDSWVGCLSPRDYENYVLPHSKQLIAGIPTGTPVIHFGTGTGTFLDLMKLAGGKVFGIDAKIRINEAWQILGAEAAIQGNLDPAILHAPLPVILEQTSSILDSVAGRPGHIFNVGHGIMPTTPVDNVKALIDFVHEYSQKSRSDNR